MIPPIKFSLVSALAAGGLAGCAVGPDYRRPEIAVSEKWVGPVSNAEVDGAWWRKFDDPLLTELVKAAILGNKDLAEESARFRQARANREAVPGRELPQATASAIATENRLLDHGTLTTGQAQWLRSDLLISATGVAASRGAMG